MYESFYGLTSKPFQLNPDPGFYYASKQHRRAMAYLEYGLHQNEGFIVITGDVGAGKTTIVRGLLNGLDSQKVVAAHLVSTQLDAEDTLRMVAAAFGVRTKDVAKADLLLSLEAFLVANAGKGKRCLLIVDEAQNLTPRAVEELRMLSNFQFEQQALLQSFLVGQPEFREILQSPHMLQLRQRVIASCHIGPLDLEETAAYIEHRLKCAGSKGLPRFEPDACEEVFKSSDGIPRRINGLCDRLLLQGYLTGKTTFNAADVTAVASEIREETQGPERVRLAGAANLASRAAAGFGAGLAAAEADLAGLVDDEALQELPALRLDQNSASELQDLIQSLNAGQLAERLLRLERSLLRLEHINSATMGLLRQLVHAARQQGPADGSSADV